MNLILLTPADFISEFTVCLSGRRFEHICQYHHPETGKQLRAGIVDGMIGHATISRLNSDSISLDVSLTEPPPPQLPLTLLMAIPRPKMLRRILQTTATLGVKELIFINSYKVEKSFWQTPLLTEDKLLEHFSLGLEQAVATQIPKVRLEKRFKPFVEDHLPTLVNGHDRALVAHPYDARPCPNPSTENTLLAIGPEGGFIPYEIEKLQEAGLSSIDLGPRILRVETALTTLLAKLF